MRQRVYLADQFTPDFGLPWSPVPSKDILATWPVEKVRHYAEMRALAEKRADENPIAGGWTLPMWERVMKNWGKYKYHIILGGNRSSKSTIASRLCTWAACTIPDAEVHCYQVNKEKSIDEQQRYVWEAIPQGIKDIQTKKGQHHSLQYSQKNGFTDGVAIFPPHSGAKRGGYIRFHNYAQFFDDASSAESFKAHVLWLDEECPQALFKTAHYRTIDYRGRIVLTFTTILGWSPLIQQLLGKTRTIEKRFAPLVGRDLPIVQETMFGDAKLMTDPQACIYYFWTEDNGLINLDDFRREMAGKPKEEILARCYGLPTKAAGSVFTLFSKEYAPVGNIVKHEEIPFIAKPEKFPVTRYMGLDPAGSKNWFVCWVGVTPDDTWWIYSEWPDFSDWAEAGSTAEGKAGPAQKSLGWGIKDYVELINEKEKETGGEAYERLIDPRGGAAEKQGDDGATSIIQQLDDASLFPPVRPAPLTRSDSGREIEVGLQLIASKLAWNTQKPRDAKNCPKLFVSDRCLNMIFALSEYTARGGSTEMTKDPIDALRMIAVADPQFFTLQKDNTPTGVY